MMNDRGVMFLNYAVCEQAVMDYRAVLLKQKDAKYNTLKSIQERIDLELFFKSDDWATMQNVMDGRKVIKLIREQAKTDTVPMLRREKRWYEE